VNQFLGNGFPATGLAPVAGTRSRRRCSSNPAWSAKLYGIPDPSARHVAKSLDE